MDEYERRWIEIISKAYPNLHNQSIVMHTSKESDKKTERIRKYFDRLDRVHDKVSHSHRKEDEALLKRFYYDMYVIKEKDIPESYFQNEARIARERGYGNIEITDEIRHNYAIQLIEDQKSSLDKWIEYFLYDEESKSYGMWEKYWVFQGITKLGKYNKETHKFSKRDSETVYTFPNVEREAIFNTLKLMEEYIKDKKSEEEIKSALGNGNFKILYEYSINQILNKGERKNNGISGRWVKYVQGSDYHKLRDSLQGYYTGWCTAAGENFAKSQLEGGDFYVYYSLDENNEAKIPRIAIRMDGKNSIGEIRGIAESQNMEPEMMPILEEKLKEFPDRDKYYKKENDMKMLTIIDKKTNNNEELSIEELNFLYEIGFKIEGFGYKKDPRIDEIISKRNSIREDIAKIFNLKPDEVALNKREFMSNPNRYKYLYGNLKLFGLRSAEKLKLPEGISGNLDLSGLASAKGLKLPESIGGNLDLDYLRSAEELELPKNIGGNLHLRCLESAVGLKIPKNIGDSLYLNNLRSAEGLELPKKINGSLFLNRISSAEGLKLPESIGGYLDLRSLKSVKDLELPQSIGGSLILSSLTSIEGLKLSENIGGDLNLSSLKNAEGLKLSENIGGDLNLSSLKNAEDLTLPHNIGGSLLLSSLTSIEGLKLSENIGGDLNLSSLKNAEGLKLSENIGGDLDLSSLQNAEGLTLPHNIGGDLDLDRLTSAKGLKLSESIGCDLDLSSLQNAEGLTLPHNIGGGLYLSNLKSAKDLELPESIGGDLDLSSLKNAEDLILPETIGGDLDLDRLTSAEGLTLPKTIGCDLDLSSLQNAEGLTLPHNIGGGLYLSNLKSAKDLELPKTIGGDLCLFNLRSAEGLKLPLDFNLNDLFCPNEIKKEILDNMELYYQNEEKYELKM